MINNNKIEESKKIIKESTFEALKRKSDVKDLYVKLCEVFQVVNDILFWIVPFNVDLLRTKSVVNSWDWDPDIYSKDAIKIYQGKESYTIWREENLWHLDDYSHCTDLEISKKIIKFKALQCPNYVTEIKKYIIDGIWKFDLYNTPKLCEKAPDDIEEVISWDEKNVLVGTTIDNIEVLSRKEWEKITKREDWFNE